MGIVYLITNSVNGKRYVGVTIRTLDKRWYYHVYCAENKLTNCYLHNAIRKYGPDSFTAEEIYQNPDEEFILKVTERHFIEEYETHVSTGKGYNMTLGGQGTWGYKHTEETKNKMSFTMRGNINPLGHNRTLIHRKRLGESNRGKIIKPLSKAKMRIAKEKYEYVLKDPSGIFSCYQKPETIL